jgi:hypothetical protein
VKLSDEEFRKLGYRAIDMAASYLAELPSRPVFQRMDESERQALMNMPMPVAPLSGTGFCGCWRRIYCLIRWGTVTRASLAG